MRFLKNELATVNGAQWQGYVVETLDHSDEEVKDREDQGEEEDLNEPEDSMLKALSYKRGKAKIDVPTYLGILNP